nr:FHA domain-containing protein At4g14490-like [Ipomoea batatas]
MLKLTMEKGPLAGQAVEFKPGIAVRVGRVVRGNNLTIQDSGISSKHLTIEFNSSDGKWFIRDLGSSNGTFLNDGKLDPSCAACLSDCDVVKIGELTSIKVQIGDAARAPTRSRRNAGRKAAIDTATSDAAAENCELGLVSEDSDRASTRPRRNPRRKAATDTTASDDGNAAVKSELGLVSEDSNRASSRPRRNPRSKAVTDTTTTADDRDAAEKCELGLVDEELGNNNKGKTGRPPRPHTRAKTQAQRDSESVKAELQPEGIELENAGISMTTSSSKAENFDGGASQVETGDNEIVENSSAIETASQYADENGDQRKTRNARGRGRGRGRGRRNRELRNLVPIEQPLAKPKRVTRSQKQINLQAESVTTEEEEGAAKMSISKEHAQCKVEAIRSMEEERQAEGYNAVEELANLREEGHNGVLNTSGANKDEYGVLEGTKCQDESIQPMEEDGQVEGNHTVEEQLTFEEEEASHGSPNVSGGNMGKPDVEEVNLEILTLGEWLDYLEIYVPKQIIDVTEEMILEMRKKAEKLQEFMLHQKNAKENT